MLALVFLTTSELSKRFVSDLHITNATATFLPSFYSIPQHLLSQGAILYLLNSSLDVHDTPCSCFSYVTASSLDYRLVTPK
jgi:hypothetical protein